MIIHNCSQEHVDILLRPFFLLYFPLLNKSPFYILNIWERVNKKSENFNCSPNLTREMQRNLKNSSVSYSYLLYLWEGKVLSLSKSARCLPRACTSQGGECRCKGGRELKSAESARDRKWTKISLISQH